MSEVAIREDRAQIPCSRETRNHLRSLKRGQQTYDGLFQAMVEQYDPASAERLGGDGGAN